MVKLTPASSLSFFFSSLRLRVGGAQVFPPLPSARLHCEYHSPCCMQLQPDSQQKGPFQSLPPH